MYSIGLILNDNYIGIEPIIIVGILNSFIGIIVNF